MSLRIIFTFGIVFNTFIFSRAQTQLMPTPEKIQIEKGCYLSLKNGISLSKNSYDQFKSYLTFVDKRLPGFQFLPIDQEPIMEIGIVGSVNAPVQLGMDESYELTINDGNITLTATTQIGVYRGLETLYQLITKNEKGTFQLSCVHIEDTPRMAWRGLMIDVARHFIPMHILKENVDAMAMVKMNTLHLHLTDDQGFRMESKLYPKLHEKGSEGLYFKQTEMKELVAYAKYKGIRIVPEFDMPSHATSWCVAYPEFCALHQDVAVEHGYGVFNASLDPSSDRTYTFINDLIGEMTTVFTDEYIHIGGDENNGKDWSTDRNVQHFMKQKGLTDKKEVQAYFNWKIEEIITQNHGKKIVGWDEIYEPGLSKNIIIQSWQGENTLEEAAENDFKVILSKGYYLDKLYSAWHYYLKDPIPVSKRDNKGYLKNIMGGEACMWTELVDSNTINTRIWPAVIGVAERLWAHETRTRESFYESLFAVSKHLELDAHLHRTNYHQAILDKYKLHDEYLLKLLVPKNGYRRHHMLKYNHAYNADSVKTGKVVDLLTADSKEIALFDQLVHKYLDSKSDIDLQVLLAVTSSWREEIDKWRFKKVDSPELEELKKHAIALDTFLYMLEKELTGEKITKEKFRQTKKSLVPMGSEYEIGIMYMLNRMFE